MLHHFNRATTNIQPTFIGSSSLRVASGNPVTVTAIANVQAGDLLIAFVVNATQTATMTGSDGFTLRSTNAGSANVWFLFTKVATGSEASYVFTPSTGATTACVLAYRGCEPCQVQVGTSTFANSATQTGASITTSNQGTLLFLGYAEVDIAVVTAPAGMTQRVIAGANTPGVTVYELANVSQGTVTGAKTIVYNNSAQGAGCLVQIKTAQRQVITPQYIAQANAVVTSASTNLTINKPTGTVENDLMVALMSSSSGTSTWSLSGWTSITSGTGQAIFYRVAGASEGASYTFVQSSSNTSQGVIATFRYCSYDAVGTALTVSPAYPSVTTASKYQLCITAASRPGTTNWTAPAGMNTIFSSGTTVGVIMSYLNAVGDGTFYGTNTSTGTGNLRSVSIALKGLVSS